MKNNFDIINYYDMKNHCFFGPEDDSKHRLEEDLRDEIEEIVELINRTLLRDRHDYLGEIGNIKINLEPTEVIKSKYAVSLDDIKKSAQKNPDKATDDFINELERFASNGERVPDGLIKEYRGRISPDIESLIRIWMLGNEVAGTFTESGKGTITLYLRTICKHADYNDYLFEVFAHEVFHAYHWFAANKKFECTWKYKNFQKDTVKEGLASYIEYKYINGYNVSLANKLENILISIKMKHYPYSSFKYINDPSFFRILFGESLEDLGTAYNFIINEGKIQDSNNNKIYAWRD